MMWFLEQATYAIINQTMHHKFYMKRFGYLLIILFLATILSIYCFHVAFALIQCNLIAIYQLFDFGEERQNESMLLRNYENPNFKV